DVLSHADVPELARASVGGDPKKAPPELAAVLGDTRFRCPGKYGPLAHSPDGKLLAVASAGRVIRILDTQTGRLAREFQSPLPVGYRVAFSPDGKTLAGTGPGGKFGLFDAVTGRLVWKLEDTQLPGVDDFAFSADGKSIGLISGTSPLVEEHE